MKGNTFHVRLDEELERLLRDFCELTNRAEAHTIRAIVGMFFADGLATADRRLSAKLWESEAAPKRPRPTAEERAFAKKLLGGRRSAPKRRERRNG